MRNKPRLQSKTREGILLPHGWYEVISPARGAYYVHYDTGVTTQTLPTGPPTQHQKSAAYREKNPKGDTDSAALGPGKLVEFCNLRTAPQFNGKRGTCVRWDPSGKIVVRLESGELKAVKPECVFAVDALKDVRDMFKQKAQAARDEYSSSSEQAADAQASGVSWGAVMLVGLGIYGLFILAGRIGHAPDDSTDLTKYPPAKLRKQQVQSESTSVEHGKESHHQTSHASARNDVNDAGIRNDASIESSKTTPVSQTSVASDAPLVPSNAAQEVPK